MKDKKGFFCENCGEKLEKNDNFCPKCGNNFEDNEETSNGSKKLIIGIIVLIAIIALISGVLLSGIGSQTQSIQNGNDNGITNGDVFSKVVQIEGVTFHIPEDYKLVKTVNNTYKFLYSYSNQNLNDSIISIAGYPNSYQFSLNDIKETWEDTGFTLTETTIGGYSGFKFNDENGFLFFIFQKGEGIFEIGSTNSSESEIARVING